VRERWTITPSFVQPQWFTGQESWPLRVDVSYQPVTLWRLARLSPLRLHQAVERCARDFRREFDYDFLQYSAREPYDTRETQAWLWTQTADTSAHTQVLGAACLRLRTYTNIPEPFWAMQWIWFHPYARRRGLFRAAWPLILTHYDGVQMEPPVSSTMQRLVAGTPTRTVHTTEGDTVRLYLPPPPQAEGDEGQHTTSDPFAKMRYLSQLSGNA
jgi:hypothetical protein